MKRVLIISPHFPPVNAADMQRVRMSLAFYKDYGWEAEVICVDEIDVDMVKDELLNLSIPKDIVVHKVKALPKRWTIKVGLGSLALRSLNAFRKKGSSLLKMQKFDLIYFSTTEFPVCILGAYWKRKYNIPFVIDMQDPWYSEYYKSLPKTKRPKKYWFSYRLHQFLEPIAMNSVDGLISVSENYISDLKSRYPKLQNIPTAVITFGAFIKDFEITSSSQHKFKSVYSPIDGKLNLVYVGRGGHDMEPALQTLFSAFKIGLAENSSLFSRFHFHFIGTSYAPQGKGEPTILPIAKLLGISEMVTEYTDRIGFYDSLFHLTQADGLLIIGSDQSAYTASKIFPYILASKPLLSVLHSESSATKILKDCNASFCLAIGADNAVDILTVYLKAVREETKPKTDWKAFEPFTAKIMVENQVKLFNQVLNFV